jgi:23S rRNA pseudouridine2605 synthase
MERLNKVLAAAGIDSRRRCDELIAAGRVKVNGHVVADLGHKVGPEDALAVDGRPVERQRFVYWLVNKPRGFLSTNFDPAGRPRVIDLLLHVPERVYSVGRLDEASEGLMLLTNDGELAQRLTHPRFGVEKTYIVQVAGQPTHEDLAKLRRGFWISEGKVQARHVKRIGARGNSTILEIVLAEGKNREIRRMLAKLGHKVMTLRRVAIGPVQLGRLKKGKARRLSLPELRELQEIAHSKYGGSGTDRRSVLREPSKESR